MPASESGLGGSTFFRWWQALFAGLAFAILAGLSYAPFNLWPLVFLAPAPLIWAAVGESQRFRSTTVSAGGKRRRMRAAIGSLRIPFMITLGVWPLWLYEQQWVMEVSGLGYVPMSFVLAAFSGAFVWALARTHARFPKVPLAIAAAFLWTAVEAFRGELAFSGYPWFLLAHPLIAIPILAAPAAVLGTYFVSFLTVGISGSLAQLAMVRRLPLGIPVGFVLLWAGGAMVGELQRLPRTPVRVGLVQTNVRTSNKLGWTPEQQLLDFDRFLDLTNEAARANPDFIVWPETMFPGLALDPPAVEELREHQIIVRVDEQVRPGGRVALTESADRLLEFQRQLGIPLVVGAGGYDNLQVEVGEAGRPTFDADARYNSAFVIEQGQVRGRFDKIKLTPFGEIMPYIHHWPWLQNRLLDLGARGMRFDLSEGKSARPVAVTVRGAPVYLATPICFEATASGTVRRIRRAAGDQPAVIVNLTNDGWFGDFIPGRWHHLQASQWRAVELQTPVLRAANTGVSAHIDAKGKLQKSGVESGGAAMVEGYLVVEAEATSGLTVFARIGNLFAWASLLAATATLLLVHFSRVRPA